MKKLCLLLVLLSVLPGRAFEIRYKTISFGAGIHDAFEILFGKLPDTAELKTTVDSLIASSPCTHNGQDTTVKDCVAMGRMYTTKTPFECCLIRTLGYRVDSLNMDLAEKQSMYKNYAEAVKTRQLSEHIIIREREYQATLYFNANSIFYGYIIYGVFRSAGDDGVLDDVNALYTFVQAKYGKPQTKKTPIAVPTQAGKKFEYATWNQQNCTLKVTLVCDGHQVWVQESVLNNKLK